MSTQTISWALTMCVRLIFGSAAASPFTRQNEPWLPSIARFAISSTARRSHPAHLNWSHTLNGSSFDLFGLDFQPIPLLHGRTPVYGFRFRNAAYFTDHSEIPETSLEQIRGLDVLFLDALRYKPHPTHSTVDRSIATAEQVGARRVFFTHICHDLAHARTEERLPPHIRLAYDGLRIEVGGAA